MHRQIILDTETTGLSPEKGHRIIEIGCLEMVNRRLTGKYFHRYINPERSVDRNAEEIHGLTNQFLEDKPLFQEILDELLDYLKEGELIIHNAPFDIGFLNHELKLSKHPKIITDYCSFIDTLQLARKKHPGQQNSLDALCRRYHVDNSNRELHGALLDAELLAQVYLLMTGGQTKLFQEIDAESISITQPQHIKPVEKDRPPLKVIYANEFERADHESYLKQMKEAGICLWEDL